MKVKRTRLGLTLLNVGKAVDVTPQQVWKYERGTSAITIDMLVLLSRVLHTTPEGLLAAKDAMIGLPQSVGPVPAAKIDVDPTFQRLRGAFEDIESEATRQLLVSLALLLARR